MDSRNRGKRERHVVVVVVVDRILTNSTEKKRGRESWKGETILRLNETRARGLSKYVAPVGLIQW